MGCVVVPQNHGTDPPFVLLVVLLVVLLSEDREPHPTDNQDPSDLGLRKRAEWNIYCHSSDLSRETFGKNTIWHTDHIFPMNRDQLHRCR